MPKVAIQRGDVVLVDLRGAEGVEKKGKRPCLVVQNNGGNAKSPLTIVAPITGEDQYKGYPTQVKISAAELGEGGQDSIVECGHLRTIDRDARIDHKLTSLAPDVMARVDAGLKASLALK